MNSRSATVMAALSLLVSTAGFAERAPHLSGEVRERIARAYDALPLAFEVNRGQTDRRVKLLCRTRDYSLFLTSNQIVMTWNTKRQTPSGRSSLRIKFLGAKSTPELHGVDWLPGTSNYLTGNDPKNWRTEIPTYSRAIYHDLYPGVDLMVYGKGSELEYDWVLAPYADATRIRFVFRGVDKLAMDSQGDLVLRIGAVEVRHRKPIITQKTGTAKRPILGGYKILPNGSVKFQIAPYDRTRELIIDPVLSFSTRFGGSGIQAGLSGGGRYLDKGAGIAVDSAGNSYPCMTWMSEDCMRS